MGIGKSRMKKVVPLQSVTEQTVCSGGGRRDGGQLFGPSTSKPWRSYSGGLDSEFSAEDLAVEVDRILAECDSTGITLNKMPMFGSSVLYYAKRKDSNNVYSGSGRDKNDVNKQTNIHVKVRPPQDLMSCANIENTAAASAYGNDVSSSPSFPILYDASEEDLMNTIERDFG